MACRHSVDVEMLTADADYQAKQIHQLKTDLAELQTVVDGLRAAAAGARQPSLLSAIGSVEQTLMGLGIDPERAKTVLGHFKQDLFHLFVES